MVWRVKTAIDFRNDGLLKAERSEHARVVDERTECVEEQ